MSEDVFDSSSESEFEDDPSSGEGNEPSTPSKNDGRSVENIYGEFSRKNKQLQEQISGLAESVQKLTEAFTKQNSDETRAQRFQQGYSPAAPSAPRAVPQHAAADLSGYSDEQLQQALASGQLSAYQRQLVEQALQERKFDQRLESRLKEREKQSEVSRLRMEAEEAALTAFPALQNKNSEFARRVEAELAQQRAKYGEFPTDKFDVANRIARVMGIEVSRIVTPGYIGRPESQGAEPDEGPEGQSDEEIRDIASNLRYALPIRLNPETGKMERKKFNLKRIKERSKEYEQGKRMFQQGRKIKGR